MPANHPVMGPRTYQRPVYENPSVCWMCDTPVDGDVNVAARWCRNGHDEVRWLAPLIQPGEQLPGDRDYSSGRPAA